MGPHFSAGGPVEHRVATENAWVVAVFSFGYCRCSRNVWGATWKWLWDTHLFVQQLHSCCIGFLFQCWRSCRIWSSYWMCFSSIYIQYWILQSHANDILVLQECWGNCNEGAVGFHLLLQQLLEFSKQQLPHIVYLPSVSRVRWWWLLNIESTHFRHKMNSWRPISLL